MREKQRRQCIILLLFNVKKQLSFGRKRREPAGHSNLRTISTKKQEFSGLIKMVFHTVHRAFRRIVRQTDRALEFLLITQTKWRRPLWPVYPWLGFSPWGMTRNSRIRFIVRTSDHRPIGKQSAWVITATVIVTINHVILPSTVDHCSIRRSYLFWRGIFVLFFLLLFLVKFKWFYLKPRYSRQNWDTRYGEAFLCKICVRKLKKDGETISLFLLLIFVFTNLYIIIYIRNVFFVCIRGRGRFKFYSLFLLLELEQYDLYEIAFAILVVFIIGARFSFIAKKIWFSYLVNQCSCPSLMKNVETYAKNLWRGNSFREDVRENELLPFCCVSTCE